MQPTILRRATGVSRPERGITLVLVAILAIVLLGLIGLAVDASHVEHVGQQLQAAADAGALAAAAQLAKESSLLGGSYPATRTAAVNAVSHNTAESATLSVNANAANSSGGEVVVGLWDSTTKTFTPTTIAPNAVKVVASRTAASAGGPLSLVFGSLFGDANGDVARNAIAVCHKPPNPLVIVLDPSATGALSMGGSTVVDATGGEIQVNSGSSCGIQLNGGAQLSSDETCVHGHACTGSNGLITNLREGADVMPDPLASILPGASDWNALRTSMPMPAGATGKIAAGGLYAPGYYPKGLSINNSDIVVLSPGTYMFGNGISTGGSSLLSGTGVTILLDSGASFSMSGGSSLQLSPPTSGTFNGLTIMCHRSTTGSGVLSLGGNGLVNCQGSVYVPSAGISLKGTGGAQSLGQVVCNTLDVSGNSHVTGLTIVPPKASNATAVLVH